MRCPDCAKFVSLEFQDPELESASCEMKLDPKGGDLTATASASVRIVRACEGCSTEMKEATFELELDEVIVVSREALLKDGHIEQGDRKKWKWKDGHGLGEVDEEPNLDQIEEGGGRYAKSFFGASATWSASCKCGLPLGEVESSDKIAASGMDELV